MWVHEKSACRLKITFQEIITHSNLIVLEQMEKVFSETDALVSVVYSKVLIAFPVP